MFKKIFKLMVFISIFFVSSVLAQNPLWLQRYQGIVQGSNDIALSMVIDQSGNTYVTGYSGLTPSTESYATVSYTIDGTDRWGPNIRYGTTYGQSHANWIELDQQYSNVVYVTGFSQDVTYKNYVTIAYNLDGTNKWNPPSTFSSHYGDSYGTMVKSDDYSNVYVTGYSTGNGSGYDYVTIMYNSSGQQQWKATYNGSGNGNDYAYAISVSGGWEFVTGVSFNGSGYDNVTVAYDGNGVQQWVMSYPGALPSMENKNLVQADAQKNAVYVTGYSNGNLAVIKYEMDNGTQFWAHADIEGYGKNLLLHRAPCGSGGIKPNMYCFYDEIYMVGMINGRFGVAKYDEGGAFDWSANYGPDGESRGLGFDSHGNVYVTGFTETATPILTLVKWSSNGGNPIWAITNSSGVDGKALVTDNNGNPIAAGFGMGDQADYITVKYSASGDGPMAFHNPNEIQNNLKPIPTGYSLEQNYPNPFNPTTKIKYGLPIDGFVTLKVFDILGKEVATLVNEYKQAGYNEVNFDASNLSSGMYFYRINSRDFVNVKKMMVVK